MIQSLFKRFLLLVLIASPAFCYAQMFSVGDEVEQRSNPFAPYIRVGIQPIDFSYTGNPAALNSHQSLAFTGTAAHISFESGGFNIGASLGNDMTGLDDRNYFDLNINFTNPFYFVRRPNFGLGVPIQLGSKITSVRSDDISEEFSQTNLHAGAGGIAQLYFPDKLGVTAQFIPSFGFSTASGGLIGGNVFSMRGKARVNFYNLIFGRNISLGYDYIFDSYDIDGDEFDYDFSGHILTLGISL
ncbi:MAG: hypothetical protein JJ953_02015 [Gracilimonas sp.]|uniref:hypothetical protein n=1 Tax=Gracilimonas TaxID=649462 RepID=UPI001B22FCB9|nr:hypothetical protein [Gracilimonas sp.]MBO6584859.1 hypothetical protein [Gracilimonas sp.]MBO6615870.1 hypothetical protein [Gracilimonas sp.]